jgi:hypothetical protein
MRDATNGYTFHLTCLQFAIWSHIASTRTVSMIRHDMFRQDMFRQYMLRREMFRQSYYGNTVSTRILKEHIEVVIALHV